MAAKKDEGPKPYSDLLPVPIDTFRQYMTFLVEHDLWDEVTTLFEARGMKNVQLRGAQVDILCEFVTAKGAEFSKDPQLARKLVLPRCSIIKPPPKTPMTPPVM